MNRPTLHTGDMLRRHIQKNRYFISALARDTGKNYYSVRALLRRSSLQTDALVDMSMALRHNFFKEIAALLPGDFPPHDDATHETEKEALRKEIEALKIENATLKDALRLVGGRG